MTPDDRNLKFGEKAVKGGPVAGPLDAFSLITCPGRRVDRRLYLRAYK
jgi:hypothetical protein